jgi:hypothetical protein
MVLKDLPGTDQYERLDIVTLYSDEKFKVRSDGAASLGSLVFRHGKVYVQ